MNAAPKISVVLIVLNGEQFIREAIDSVICQSTNDWELVAVDDGSTDTTPEILAEFATTHPDRIRVVQHAGGMNRGMSASRNLGIQESRGEYVTFLDHDDALLPDKLESHISILQQHEDAAAVISPNLRWYSWADAGRNDEPQDLGLPADTVIAPPGPLAVFLTNTSATPLGFTVRRSALEDIGGYDESFPGMYEDQVLQAKLYLQHAIYVTGTVSHRYRQHADSCVTRTFESGTQLLARRRFLLWLNSYLDQIGLNQPALRNTLQAELAKTRGARTHWIKRQLIRVIGRLTGRNL